MNRTSTGIISSALLLSFSYGHAQENRVSKDVILLHQRCALHAVEINLRNAKKVDAALVDKSIKQCEPLLAPLKRNIISKTHDAKFAELQLEKIRKASKRGVTIAIVSYIAKRSN